MNSAVTKSNSREDSAFDIKAGPALLSAATITGDDVCNMQGEKLGTIQDIMLDIQTGRIRYAVLSSGGFLGMGDRLFAVPWNAFRQDKENRRFILDVDVKRLKQAPGFDKEHWPNMADASWNSTIESYYATRSDSPRS
jgi:sporulation protein YlmC with PRC-barrel domain